MTPEFSLVRTESLLSNDECNNGSYRQLPQWRWIRYRNTSRMCKSSSMKFPCFDQSYFPHRLWMSRRQSARWSVKCWRITLMMTKTRQKWNFRRHYSAMRESLFGNKHSYEISFVKRWGTSKSDQLLSKSPDLFLVVVHPGLWLFPNVRMTQLLVRNKHRISSWHSTWRTPLWWRKWTVICKLAPYRQKTLKSFKQKYRRHRVLWMVNLNLRQAEQWFELGFD